MAELGKFNLLEINKIIDYGVYLDGQQLGLILLPKKFVPENPQIGDPLEVFVYLDSNDELIATTDSPKVTLGLCAYLKIIQVNNVGAFADWGLPKDLLIPFAEQSFPLKEGQHITVCLYQDRASKRLVGSTKLSKHLNEFSSDFEVHQEVDLLICGRSDLGYKAVINNSHLGLIHISDIFKPPRMGQMMKAYIKEIRPDKKINLCFHLPNKQQLGDLALKILEDLKEQGGESKLTDKSQPDDIYFKWNVSKGSYKKAIGSLYKQRLITIDRDYIKLL